MVVSERKGNRRAPPLLLVLDVLFFLAWAGKTNHLPWLTFPWAPVLLAMHSFSFFFFCLVLCTMSLDAAQEPPTFVHHRWKSLDSQGAAFQHHVRSFAVKRTRPLVLLVRFRSKEHSWLVCAASLKASCEGANASVEDIRFPSNLN